MTASERVSVWIPEHLRAVLDVEDDGPPGLSGRIAAILDRYAHLLADAAPALRRAEWCLILDACNGWASWAEAGETLMIGLAAEVEDHVRLNDAGTKWNLNAEECQALIGRLRGLRPVGTIGLLERVERFWRRAAMDTDAAMMASGIHPTDAPELAYEVRGDVVIRTAPPRFRLPMTAAADGGWTGENPKWLDAPPPDASMLAGWMREAGEAFAALRRG